MKENQTKSRVPFLSRIKPFISLILGGTKEERTLLKEWYGKTSKRLNKSKSLRYGLLGVNLIYLPLLILAVIANHSLLLGAAFAPIVLVAGYSGINFVRKAEYEKWKLYRE